MAKSGWLIWRSRFIEWKHHVFVSKTNLTHRPHFEITVTDINRDGRKSITFDNVQVPKQSGVTDLLKLTDKSQQIILNNAVDAWEREYIKS